MPAKPVIQLHNLSPDQCKSYAKKIKAINGVYVNTKHFQRNVTHLVCGELTCSEKFLGACVTGCWVLSPAFIDESHTMGKWLKEDDYQFRVCDNQPAELLSAYKRWHWKIRNYKEFPFSGWEVALLLCPENLQQLRRVLVYGDATIVPMSVPLRADKDVPEVTYVVMDTSSRHFAPELSDFGLLCINYEYIVDCIIKEIEPEVFDYVVTAEVSQDASSVDSVPKRLLEDTLGQGAHGSDVSLDSTLLDVASVSSTREVTEQSVSATSSTVGSHSGAAEVSTAALEPLQDLLSRSIRKDPNIIMEVMDEEMKQENLVAVRNKSNQDKRTPISSMDPNIPVTLQQTSGRRSKRGLSPEPGNRSKDKEGRRRKRVKISEDNSLNIPYSYSSQSSVCDARLGNLQSDVSETQSSAGWSDFVESECEGPADTLKFPEEGKETVSSIRVSRNVPPTSDGYVHLPVNVYLYGIPQSGDDSTTTTQGPLLCKDSPQDTESKEDGSLAEAQKESTKILGRTTMRNEFAGFSENCKEENTKQVSACCSSDRNDCDQREAAMVQCDLEESQEEVSQPSADSGEACDLPVTPHKTQTNSPSITKVSPSAKLSVSPNIYLYGLNVESHVTDEQSNPQDGNQRHKKIWMRNGDSLHEGDDDNENLSAVSSSKTCNKLNGSPIRDVQGHYGRPNLLDTSSQKVDSVFGSDRTEERESKFHETTSPLSAESLKKSLSQTVNGKRKHSIAAEESDLSLSQGSQKKRTVKPEAKTSSKSKRLQPLHGQQTLQRFGFFKKTPSTDSGNESSAPVPAPTVESTPRKETIGSGASTSAQRDSSSRGEMDSGAATSADSGESSKQEPSSHSCSTIASSKQLKKSAQNSGGRKRRTQVSVREFQTVTSESFPKKSWPQTAAKVNKCNQRGESALHLAAMKNNHAKMAFFLQIPGVNVNIKDFAGWTPLHEACNHGSYDCVKLLLEYSPTLPITADSISHVGAEFVTNKVDMGVKGPWGITPLHDAVINNKADICRLLLRYGGEELLQEKDDSGRTALQYANTDELRNVLTLGISGRCSPLIKCENESVPKSNGDVGRESVSVSSNHRNMGNENERVILHGCQASSSVSVIVEPPVADGDTKEPLPVPIVVSDDSDSDACESHSPLDNRSVRIDLKVEVNSPVLPQRQLSGGKINTGKNYPRDKDLCVESQHKSSKSVKRSLFSSSQTSQQSKISATNQWGESSREVFGDEQGAESVWGGSSSGEETSSTDLVSRLEKLVDHELSFSSIHLEDNRAGPPEGNSEHREGASDSLLKEKRVVTYFLSYPSGVHVRLEDDLRQIPILHEQCIEAAREMDYREMALMHCIPCSDQLPTAGLLREIVSLASSDEPHIATRACAYLKTWLDFHPPVTLDLVQTYTEALELSGPNSLLLKTLEHLSNQTEAESESIILLLEYLVSAFEVNYNDFVTSENKKGLQGSLVVQAFWEHSHAVCYSSRVKDLMLALQTSLRAPALSCRSQHALLSLVALVSHSLHLSSVRWQPQSPSSLLDNNLQALAHELSRIMKEACPSQGTLAALLSCLNPPWLRLLVLSIILSTYNDYLLRESIRVGNITLRAIMFQFFYLLPSLQEVVGRRESQSKHTKNSTRDSPANSVKNSPEKALTAAKVNKRNGKGESALHRAAIKNDYNRMKLLLTVPGVNVNLKDNNGWTPLHEACNHGSYACVELLLKYVPLSHTTIDSFFQNQDSVTNKVDISARGGDDNITPLHDAVRNNRADVCRLLLRYGGEKLLQAKDKNGVTPFQYAKTEEFQEMLISCGEGNYSQSDSEADLSYHRCLEIGEQGTSCAPPQLLYDQVLGSDSSRTVASADYSELLSLISLMLSSYAEWKGLCWNCSGLVLTDSDDVEIRRHIGEHWKMFVEHVRKTTTAVDFAALEADLLVLSSLCMSLSINIKR